MKTTRRTLLKNAAALGAFAGAGFPHIWIKNADLASAASGEIKVGVLGGVQSLFGTVISAFALGEVTGVIAFLQNDTIAKAIVLILIISVIRFRPQGLLVAKVRA